MSNAILTWRNFDEIAKLKSKLAPTWRPEPAFLREQAPDAIEVDPIVVEAGPPLGRSRPKLGRTAPMVCRIESSLGRSRRVGFTK